MKAMKNRPSSCTYLFFIEHSFACGKSWICQNTRRVVMMILFMPFFFHFVVYFVEKQFLVQDLTAFCIMIRLYWHAVMHTRL